jgi:hypothetical protein
MTDIYKFENREISENLPQINGFDEQVEQVIVGGMSVSTILKKSKKTIDIDSVLFNRFTNLVVPLGLQFCNILPDEEEAYNEIKGLIDNKKFDQLFYSVGKDLGISKTRTYKNKTSKKYI